jgi:uncharacterized protein (TIGR02996 family)
MYTQVALLAALLDDPGDEPTWQALADCLEELRQADRAELVRLRRALRLLRAGAERQTVEGRVQALLAAGAKRCVPVLPKSIGMQLALIPAGRFLMGAPANESRHPRDERPQHQVKFTRQFCLSAYEVTQEQYQRVMGSTRAASVRRVTVRSGCEASTRPPSRWSPCHGTMRSPFAGSCRQGRRSNGAGGPTACRPRLSGSMPAGMRALLQPRFISVPRPRPSRPTSTAAVPMGEHPRAHFWDALPPWVLTPTTALAFATCTATSGNGAATCTPTTTTRTARRKTHKGQPGAPAEYCAAVAGTTTAGAAAPPSVKVQWTTPAAMASAYGSPVRGLPGPRKGQPSASRLWLLFRASRNWPIASLRFCKLRREMSGLAWRRPPP